jgi:hypothetical protein
MDNHGKSIPGRLTKKPFSEIDASGASYAVSPIITGNHAEKPAYQPKTPLGKKLVALREQAIARGLNLLDEDEIVEEIGRRRGETVG